MARSAIALSVAVGSAAVVVYGIAVVFAGLYPKIATQVFSSLVQMRAKDFKGLVSYFSFETTPTNFLLSIGMIFVLGVLFTLIAIIFNRILTGKRKNIFCVSCEEKI